MPRQVRPDAPVRYESTYYAPERPRLDFQQIYKVTEETIQIFKRHIKASPIFSNLHMYKTGYALGELLENVYAYAFIEAEDTHYTKREESKNPYFGSDNRILSSCKKDNDKFKPYISSCFKGCLKNSMNYLGRLTMEEDDCLLDFFEPITDLRLIQLAKTQNAYIYIDLIDGNMRLRWLVTKEKILKDERFKEYKIYSENPPFVICTNPREIQFTVDNYQPISYKKSGKIDIIDKYIDDYNHGVITNTNIPLSII